MNELEHYFGQGSQLVTLNVTYYRPDHNWLLQDFIWQTLDVVPSLPRVQQFLEFWNDNIEAAIKSAEVAFMLPSGRPHIMVPVFDGVVD